MSEAQSAPILQIFVPLFAILFTLLAKFVLGKIPLEKKFAWKIVCAGGYVVITGAALVIYLELSRPWCCDDGGRTDRGAAAAEITGLGLNYPK